MLLISAASAISTSATVPTAIAASVVIARMMMRPRRRVCIVMSVVMMNPVILSMSGMRVRRKVRGHYSRRYNRIRWTVVLSGVSSAVPFALIAIWITSDDKPDHGKDKYENKYRLNNPTDGNHSSRLNHCVYSIAERIVFLCRFPESGKKGLTGQLAGLYTVYIDIHSRHSEENNSTVNSTG